MEELVHNKRQDQLYRQRAAALVEQMTLQEKISQMLNAAPAIERLGIPAYNWWNEGLHGVARSGVATVFPQAIAMAAAWDEDMMEAVGDAIATEGRGKYNLQRAWEDRDIYKGLTFWAPNINIFRDPRWGRGHETLGEDPYLTGLLGKRFVQGIQGHDPKYLKAAACAKHFAVHSGPEDVRHSFNAEVSRQDLWETYLPAFRTLVEEAKVEAVMGAYNRTNGEPCCGSRTLLTDILREKWGFSGHVTSDCWAIKDFHEGHMVTNGPVESVALAVNSGCDLNCGNLFAYLDQAVKAGLVSEEAITEAVTRLFTTRMKLGMFDAEEEVPFNQIGYDQVDTAKMRELNREVAEKTLVLLKNRDGILPLDKSKLKCVGVIGPNADNRKALVGNYEGTASRYATVLEGIQDYLGDEVRVMYSEGCPLFQDRFQNLSAASGDRFSEVRGVCEQSDVVIACLGLDAGLEGEEGDQGNQFASGDKPNLRLPGHQEELLQLILDSGKPTIVVLISGSALAINTAEEKADAVLLALYPGAQGGNAVARTLFGEVNPQGKLPITFYRSDEELPPFTDYSMKGRTYRYMEQEALYPFGYGLSYTRFRLDGAAAGAAVAEEGVDVTLSVENVGGRFGCETVQAYVKAERPGTPNAQLKAVAKAALAPGEKKTVTLHLPLAAFALCDEEGTSVVEPGTYTVYVGASQPDRRSAELTGQQPQRLVISVERRWTLP